MTLYCDYKINLVVTNLNTFVEVRFYEGDFSEQVNPITNEATMVYQRKKIFDSVSFWFEGLVPEEEIREKILDYLKLIKGKRTIVT